MVDPYTHSVKLTHTEFEHLTQIRQVLKRVPEAREVRAVFRSTLPEVLELVQGYILETYEYAKATLLTVPTLKESPCLLSRG